MGTIVEEVRLWNTPIVGSYLLWRFTEGYTKNHNSGKSPNAILHFIAMGILSDYQMLDLISDRRIDLQAFVRGFDDKKRTDILINLNKQIISRRFLTLEAIDIAIAYGLLKWEAISGELFYCKLEKKASKGYGLKLSMKLLGNKAEILGKWFSKYDEITVAAHLEVNL